jgi:endogenous inhibitor of DNA gyrase (YacG/DUF329 family)
MWTCPECGRTFANPSQSHACAPLGELDDHDAELAGWLAEAYRVGAHEHLRR